MYNRKSILRVLLVFAMVTLLTAAVTFGAAYAFDGNAGECGKGVSWSYADGTLTVSGEGMMSNFRYDTMPWYHLKNEVTTVVIEEGVTHVGELSFYGFDKITEVSLPESTVSIGQYAFYSCRALKSITVPEGVTAIGQYAFRKTDLTSAYMSTDGWSAGATALSGLDNAEEAAKMLTSISEGYCFYLVNWSRTVETEITVIDGGTCGKNVTWTVYSNGLLEILGTGDMKDYGA